MTAEDWEKITELFNEAVALSPRKRRSLLKSVKDDSSAAFTVSDELAPEQYQEVAARYNGGPYWRSEAAQAYGRGYMNGLDAARAALGPQ